MHNLINWFQQSLLVPDFIRAHMLRLLGYSIDKKARIASGVFLGSRNFQMGPRSFINVNCFLDGCSRIELGEYVHLGPHVKILTGTHTYDHSVLRRAGSSTDIFKPVIIKRGCWVGMGAIILPGVVLEEGCIIGAGAVVTRSTQANGLYLGNPAKRVRDLPEGTDPQVTGALVTDA